MPKLSTFRTFPFTADVWNYTRRTDPTGAPIYTYFLLRNVEISLTQSMFGKVTVTFSDDTDDVMSEAQLRNVIDKEGRELHEGGIWTLSGLVPIITPFGTREGYRAEAKLTFLED